MRIGGFWDAGNAEQLVPATFSQSPGLWSKSLSSARGQAMLQYLTFASTTRRARAGAALAASSPTRLSSAIIDAVMKYSFNKASRRCPLRSMRVIFMGFANLMLMMPGNGDSLTLFR